MRHSTIEFMVQPRAAYPPARRALLPAISQDLNSGNWPHISSISFFFLFSLSLSFAVCSIDPSIYVYSAYIYSYMICHFFVGSRGFSFYIPSSYLLCIFFFFFFNLFLACCARDTHNFIPAPTHTNISRTASRVIGGFLHFSHFKPSHIFPSTFNINFSSYFFFPPLKTSKCF